MKRRVSAERVIASKRYLEVSTVGASHLDQIIVQRVAISVLL